MARRKTKISKPKRETFAIVVDGETEVYYFQMMKRNEPNLQVNIEPKLPQKKKLSELYKTVKELSENYTTVYWIIDLDAIIKEAKETKKGKENQIQKLKKYVKELNEKKDKDGNFKYKNVITIFNNPCLEFWFLIHFVQTTKYFPRCNNVTKELKKYLRDYKKTQKYFTKQNKDIYLKLKSKLPTAIKNTQKTQMINLDEINCAICEMNLFFETEQVKK